MYVKYLGREVDANKRKQNITSDSRTWLAFLEWTLTKEQSIFSDNCHKTPITYKN